MPFEVNADETAGAGGDAGEIHAEPADAHAPDRDRGGQGNGARELVEDELLLALPFAPRHEDCSRRAARQDERRERFAVRRAARADAQQALITRSTQGGVRTWQSSRTRSRRRKRGMHRSHDHLTQAAARGRADHAARCTCATTSARPATTAARRSSRPRTSRPRRCARAAEGTRCQ